MTRTDTTTAGYAATDAFELPHNLGLATAEPAARGDEDADGARALNPVPDRLEVLREQFAAVGLGMKREIMLVCGLALLFTFFVMWVEVNGEPGGIPLDPQMGIAAALAALLVPMAVWKGEGPSRRGYHHGMPVDQAEHAVARTGAGLAWMMIGVVAFFGWMALLMSLTGGLVAQVEPWQWVAPFVGATVTYLLGSALTLLTDHPWRWLGGGAVGFVFLNIFRAIDAASPLGKLLDAVLLGDYGFSRLLTGTAPPFITPDFGAWLASVWIWVVAAVGAFLFAAHRQPES
ncbi:MAG TPA: hypothetical protein VJT67_03980 [Longimicrobiaceae bacterium]|nr:hypothetical protein [Longimicrobiaceae bacterium]